jgi:tetratricopeptide (TPR) repeat protein
MSKKILHIRRPTILVALVGLTIAGCGQPNRQPAEDAGASASSVKAKATETAKQLPKQVPPDPFAGSKACADCHADFHKLWVSSWHGLAMQPYTADFARRELAPQEDDVTIGKRAYHAEIAADAGWIREKGPDGEKQYPIAHVMGGKNIYYFLTRLERGRLQVLPLAYDVHKKSWYDTAASGVRHFPDRNDEALDWTDRMYTFNTTCFNCHVSRLATTFDLGADTYHTTWPEPGISCESCHGPGGEHVRVMQAAANPRDVQDIKILRTRDFTPQQMNDLCATCHAKMVPLSMDFTPGAKFFDHFDLVTLEHADFYPDGRDLGENYTYTSWLTSPCAKGGKLDCNHCHTPSGRMRFTGEESNESCMPCHTKQVEDPVAHGHHPAGSKGNECIACHMPMTRFAAMMRSDHSMRPPTPATTLAFKSPNACNMCHEDKDATWADKCVREWYPNDYQAQVLRRAELIDAARKQQWQRLPEMLTELTSKDGDAVYQASLARLVRTCPDPRVWPAMLTAMKAASPLVRSSAASAAADHLTPETLKALLEATRDESRLVRIRAIMALASVHANTLPEERDRQSYAKALAEFEASMHTRADDWAAHANLGNFYMEQQDFDAAVNKYEIAHKLEPRIVGPMANAAIAYSNLGRNQEAESCLRRALKAEPANAAIHFNLGLLMGEQGKLAEAEQALRTALKSDPQMASAAYNLGVILAKKDIEEALTWCGKACQLRPDEPKYAHTLAFFQRQKGDKEAAVRTLRQSIARHQADLDCYLLLGDIYEDKGDLKAAVGVYSEALRREGLPAAVQQQLQAKIRAMDRGH